MYEEKKHKNILTADVRRREKKNVRLWDCRTGIGFHKKFVVIFVAFVVVQFDSNVHMSVTQRKTSIFNTTYAFRNSLQIFNSTLFCRIRRCLFILFFLFLSIT